MSQGAKAQSEARAISAKKPRSDALVPLPRSLSVRGFHLVEERVVFDRPGTYQYTFPRGSRNFVVDLWGAGSGGAGNPYIALVFPGDPVLETIEAFAESGGGGGAHVTGTALAPAAEGPEVTVRVVIGAGGAGGLPVEGDGMSFPSLTPIGGKAGGASSVTFAVTGEQYSAGGGYGMTPDPAEFVIPTDAGRGGSFFVPPTQPLLKGTPGQDGARGLSTLTGGVFAIGGSGGAASQGGPGGHGGGSLIRTFPASIPAEADRLIAAGRAGIAPGGGGGGAGNIQVLGSEISQAWAGMRGGAGADGQLAVKYLRLVRA